MSIVATLMQPLRQKYTPGTLDKNELRPSRYGVWDFFQKQTSNPTGVLTSDVRAAIKNSIGNTVVIPVYNADNITISNTRACTVADSENTTALVTLTFATYSFGFTMIPAQYGNNDIKYQDDFNRKMEKYLIKFADTLDTAAAGQLATNRNQFFPAAITAYYPNVGNALQIADAEKDDFYNQFGAIMQTMDFYDSPNILTSTSGLPMVSRLKAQGAGNSTNQAFQFDQYNWIGDNRITNGAGIRSTLYGVTDGVVAVENRNDWDAINKSKVGNGLKVWDEVTLPLVNLKMGSYYYEDCADKSALTAGTTHLTRTKIEGFEFSTDICFATTYNSSPSTRYNPIIKAEVSLS